jgi:hypothetical protein
VVTIGERQRDPLQPLTTVVELVYWLAVSSLVAGLGLALLGAGSIFGWGRDFHDLCVSIDGRVMGSGGAPAKPYGHGLLPGVGYFTRGFNVCVRHPSVGQSAVGVLMQLPGFVLFLGTFYAVRRLLRDAVRDGLFTAGFARWLRLLGWWLLAGEVVSTLIEAAAHIVLVDSMVTPGIDFGQWYGFLHGSWVVVFLGVGLLTLARIARVGAGMREDLEGTV